MKDLCEVFLVRSGEKLKLVGHNTRSSECLKEEPETNTQNNQE